MNHGWTRMDTERRGRNPRSAAVSAEDQPQQPRIRGGALRNRNRPLPPACCGWCAAHTAALREKSSRCARILQSCSTDETTVASPATEAPPHVECGDLSPLSRGDSSPSNAKARGHAVERRNLAPAVAHTHTRTARRCESSPNEARHSDHSRRAPRPLGPSDLDPSLEH